MYLGLDGKWMQNQNGSGQYLLLLEAILTTILPHYLRKIFPRGKKFLEETICLVSKEVKPSAIFSLLT
jgi:hypothetical protein